MRSPSASSATSPLMASASGPWRCGRLAFIGYTGLVLVPYAAAFTPAVEIGWRIQKAHWGHGYVSEAARLALADAFTRFGLKEVVALTVPANTRSQAVMHRLGMTPIRRRISTARWCRAATA